MDSISSLLVAIPALPLASAILTAALGPRWLKERSHWLTIAALGVACWLSVLLAMRVHEAQSPSDPGLPQPAFERVVTLWTWADVEQAYRQARVPPGESDLSMSDGGLRDFRIDIALRADGLTAMMLCMVTFVATLVAVFAAGYMHGDRSYWRFFAYVSLFVFSMTMLVSVSNFLLLYVFWEAVGVCSYLLIGFWYEKPEAAAAGKKAFLVNRIGDFGFAVALFLIWTTYGTLNFHDSLQDGRTDEVAIQEAVEAARNSTDGADPQLLAAQAEPAALVRGVLGPLRIRANDYAGGAVALGICLLLLLGACGKSAQFPLHVWLPDAMEGPTPVSALIHAATMVTAGVYMIARCSPLFMASPEAQCVVACIGGVTALLAALIALTQFDLKRVLAYSTVSQLGFMFLGLGAGSFAGITSGMFHLFTHAFFKALLFLGAGSVMHAMGHIIDMRRFGGLRTILPTTHAAFAVGCLALAGIPPLAGFWSKDGIVAAIEVKGHEMLHPSSSDGHGHNEAARDGQSTDASHSPLRAGAVASLSDATRARLGWIYSMLYYVALLTAFLTAFYTFRAFYLTFYGELRVPHEAGDHAHESPHSMTVPLLVLAVFAAVTGLLLDHSYWSTPDHLFANFIGSAPSLALGSVAATRHPYEFHLTVAGYSTCVALAGWLIATYLYLGDQWEIAWLKSVLDFEKPARWLDVESVSSLRKVPIIAGIHQLAGRVGLGRITAGLGQVILFLVLVLATPFLLGHYLSPYKLSQSKFYFDEIYQLAVVMPCRLAAQACYAIDRWVVDGAINALGRLPAAAGSLMRSLQMGLVPFYALAMLLGALVLFAAQMLWAAS